MESCKSGNISGANTELCQKKQNTHTSQEKQEKQENKEKIERSQY